MTNLYNGWTPPKKTMEQARLSQAHWHGIDPDKWWAYCQSIARGELRTWKEFKSEAR